MKEQAVDAAAHLSDFKALLSLWPEHQDWIASGWISDADDHFHELP